MGGGSKKQKVGNKYYFGVVTVPLRQHDYISAIEMSEKLAWDGSVKHGPITINKPKLFGGDEREGGFQGTIDVQSGGLEQGINSYLAGAKETLTGAMRGCVSMVYRKPYFGANTARLPKIRTRHTNVEGIHQGWLPQQAVIDPELVRNDNAFYICFDGDRFGDFVSWAAHKDALVAWVRSFKGQNYTNSFYVIFAQPLGGTQTTQRIKISTDAEYESLAGWIAARTRSGINSWVNNIDLSNAAAFFSAHDDDGGSTNNRFFEPVLQIFGSQTEEAPVGKRYVIVSNNSMRGNEIDGYTYVGAFNAALASLDVRRVMCIGGAINTSGTISDQRPGLVLLNGQEGVTTASDILWVTGDSNYSLGSAGDIAAAIAFFNEPFQAWADMNPAHIIRCLWIDPMRGGTATAADIGDSFAAEAARYAEEGLGLSCKFRGLDQADSDRLEVERHIDAISYRDNATGKIELVSIRNDYTIGDLDVLDSDVVMDWSGLSRPRKSEIPNQLTVEYTRRDGKKGSVTRTNVAGVRRQGRVIKAQQVQYPWVTTESLATRLCLRDLRTVTSDILSGTIPLSYLPVGIKPGSVVVLNEPTIGINNVVMRVTEIRIGQYDDSTVTLTVSEDKYASTQAIAVEEFDYTNLRPARDVNPRLVLEASYYQLVLAAGQSMVDDELALEPDLGRLYVTGAPADQNQLDARVATAASGAALWEDKGPVDFEPYGVLVNDLSADPTVTSFLVHNNNSLDEIFAGDLCRLGNEVMRIDDLEEQGDGTTLISVGRGCLDGPPHRHAAGSAFVVTSVVEPMIEDYIAGQTVDVKLLSRTGSNEQTLNEAATESLTFSSRAFRPYPVGKFQADAAYSIQNGASGTITATWTHRDRTIQTTPVVDDHTADNIGPEMNVVYTPFRRIYKGHESYFAPTSYFERDSYFTNFESYDETAFDAIAQSLTYDFAAGDQSYFARSSYFEPDSYFSNSFGPDTSLVGIGVRVSRDGYDNLHDVEIQYVPLLPSIFTATAGA